MSANHRVIECTCAACGGQVCQLSPTFRKHQALYPRHLASPSQPRPHSNNTNPSPPNVQPLHYSPESPRQSAVPVAALPADDPQDHTGEESSIDGFNDVVFESASDRDASERDEETEEEEHDEMEDSTCESSTTHADDCSHSSTEQNTSSSNEQPNNKDWTQPIFPNSPLSIHFFLSFIFDWQSRYNVTESATQELMMFLGSIGLPQDNKLPTYAQAKREAMRFVNTKTHTINGQKFTHIPLVDQLQSEWGQDYFRKAMQFPLPQRTDGLIEEVADTPVFKEFRSKTGGHTSFISVSYTYMHTHTSHLSICRLRRCRGRIGGQSHCGWRELRQALHTQHVTVHRHLRQRVSAPEKEQRVRVNCRHIAWPFSTEEPETFTEDHH